MGWYIRLNPDDVNVLQRLGLLLADRAQDGGTAGQAFSKLESVLRLDPNRKDVRRRLVDVALMIGRFSDAREHLRDFLLKQSPDDPELLELMGRCQAAMSDEGQAVETFKKVIEFAPKQVDAYPRLAGVLRYQLSRPKEADQWMEKLVKVNPDSFKAHLLRGSYLKNIDANDEALKESLIALKLAPKEGDELRDALWLAAQCSAAKEKYDDARNYAQQGIKLFPGNVVLYTTLADVELRSGQREKAVEVLDQGLKATHDDPQLLWAKANLLIDTNKIPEAQKTIADLQATGYPKGLIEYLLARIELVQGRWLPARVGFENARGTLTMWPNLLKQVDFWIGQCYGQLNNNDQQLAAYRRALKLDPFYTPARNGLIEALMASGQLDDALNEYSDLAKMGKVSSAGLIPWARMLILRNLRVDPAARNWEPVNKLLDEAEKATPESSQIPVLRAEILVAQDRAEDAGKLLANVREKDPKKAEIWSVMASLAQRQGNWDAAEKVLDEAEKASGDTVDVRVARAQYLIRRYAADAKDRVRALAENTAKWTDAQRLQLCGGLLSAALQIDDTEFAKKLCRQIADKEPNNVQVRVLMFEQALRAENDAELEQTLKEIERVAGRGSFWLYGQAVRLSLKAKNDNEKSDELQAQALRYLAQAQELRTNWSRIPLLMGSIYDQQGKTNQALRNYQDAIDLGERNPGAIRRAVQLLFQKQQYADADKLLRQLERQQMPFSPELNRAGAEVALRQGDYNRALALAKKTAAEDSKDYQSHLWLGQMLGVLSSQAKAQGAQKEADELMAEAEKSLRRAVEVEPKNAATWVSLIQFLAANDRASEAEKGIEEAQKDIPEKQAALALAQCYEAVEKPDDAQKSYEAALSATPKDPFVVRAVADFYYRNSKPIPAEALLRRIIDGKVDAQESDVIWARRQLASIFASRGGYQNIQKARTLIEENLTAAEGSAYDRRAKVTLDAADPLRSRRDQAIQGLEKLIESQVATPDDCLNLAQMYLAVGDWQKASNLLRDLVAKHGGEPRFLAAYIRALLDHKETTTAQTYLRKLERIAPTHYVTVSLNAEVLFLKKDYEKSRDVMKHFLDDNDSQPADRNVRLRLVAETLEQFGRRLTKASDKNHCRSLRSAGRDALPLLRRSEPRPRDAPRGVPGPPGPHRRRHRHARPQLAGQQRDRAGASAFDHHQGRSRGQGAVRAARPHRPGGAEGVRPARPLVALAGRHAHRANPLWRRGNLLPRGAGEEQRQRDRHEQPRRDARPARRQAGRGEEARRSGHRDRRARSGHARLAGDGLCGDRKAGAGPNRHGKSPGGRQDAGPLFPPGPGLRGSRPTQRRGGRHEERDGTGAHQRDAPTARNPGLREAAAVGAVAAATLRAFRRALGATLGRRLGCTSSRGRTRRRRRTAARSPTSGRRRTSSSSAPGSLLVPSAFLMKKLTQAVKKLPTALESRYRPMISDFIFFGAWV